MNCLHSGKQYMFFKFYTNIAVMKLRWHFVNLRKIKEKLHLWKVLPSFSIKMCVYVLTTNILFAIAIDGILASYTASKYEFIPSKHVAFLIFFFLTEYFPFYNFILFLSPYPLLFFSFPSVCKMANKLFCFLMHFNNNRQKSEKVNEFAV